MTSICTVSYTSFSHYGQGYIHKLITIDSPHLGSVLATRLLAQAEAGGCLQGLLAGENKFAFNTVTIDGQSVPGAVGDLIDNPLSNALNAVATNASHPLPTSMISGNYTNWSSLDTSFRAIFIRNWCGSDSLAQQLTSNGWPQLFGNAPTDAIVSVTSQYNNLPPIIFSQFPDVHSPGTEKLGFSGPSVMDDQAVANPVIFLLNKPLTNTVYYVQMNP